MMVSALLAAALLSGSGHTPATEPNPAFTPGVIRTDITGPISCRTKWGRDRRHVTESMKRAVAARYGIPWPTPTARHKLTRTELAYRAQWEVDHFIPRELGGADHVDNLWLEPMDGPWNAHLKDHLENTLHIRVCSKAMTLAAAQEAMRSWQKAYLAYVDAHVR